MGQFPTQINTWQRCTCENTNGLLRQYLPKGIDLSIYSQDELDAIADSPNCRPRPAHAFHSPFEVFERMLATAAIISASIHYPLLRFTFETAVKYKAFLRTDTYHSHHWQADDV